MALAVTRDRAGTFTTERLRHFSAGTPITLFDTRPFTVGRFCYAVRMTLDAVKRCLIDQRDLLLEHGVSAIYVFGSVARGRATAQSDIDLLVEFSRPIGLVGFVRLQQRLAAVLGHPVDLVTPAALKPQLRARILREAVRAA